VVAASAGDRVHRRKLRQRLTRAQLAAFAAAQGLGGLLVARTCSRTLCRHRLPTENYRFYWNTPIHLSPHNPRVIYVGGNRLFRSLDRGDTWTATIDLTKQIDRNTLPIMGVPGKGPDGFEARRLHQLWLRRDRRGVAEGAGHTVGRN
jgi:hypothetical protein